MSYFLTRNNAFYSVLVSMSSAYRYLATVLVLIVISYIWFFGVYMPAQAVLNQHQTEVNLLSERREHARALRTATAVLRRSIDATLKDLRQYSSTKKSTTHEKTPLLALMQLAKKQGLQIKSCTLGTPCDYAYSFDEKVNMQFHGSLDQIQSFFKALQASKLLIKHDAFALAAQGEQRFDLSCSFACTTLKTTVLS